METQREKWERRTYAVLRQRFGETAKFKPVVENPRTGFSQDSTRSPFSLQCLVVRGTTEDSDVSFGKRVDLFSLAVGEVGLKCLRDEFGEEPCQKGDFVSLQSQPDNQQLIIDQIDKRHPPFIQIRLVKLGSE